MYRFTEDKLHSIPFYRLTYPTLLLWILSRTFRSSPCSHLPSGRDRRDRTCDTPLPCCTDSPLSASPDLWYSAASSAKNEAESHEESKKNRSDCGTLQCHTCKTRTSLLKPWKPATRHVVSTPSVTTITLRRMAWSIPAVQKTRWVLTPATTTPTASESATRVVSTRKASLPTLALQPRRILWKTSSTVSPSTIPMPRS